MRYRVSSSNTQRETLQFALLASERLRIVSILVLVTALLLAYFLRIVVFGLTINWAVIAALLALVAIEIAVFQAVANAQRAKISVHPTIWVGSTVAEMSVPCLCIAFLSNPNVPFLYRSLATPWALLLFPLIALSTLRLKPSFSLFAGATATCFYLTAAYHNGWRLALFNPTQILDTNGTIVFYALILLGAGLAAATVAAEIRRHAEAALAELSARQQLKQVQHDLELARSIQRSLLPRESAKLRGFEIAGWNRSADATGGDYFDWKYCSGGRLVITLADVSGHGIGPALLAAVSRAYARASFEGTDCLGCTMQKLNRLLAADLTPPHFITLVAVVCNENDGTVQLFSAGQGPLFMYVARTDTLALVESNSIPLGLLAEIDPVEHAVLHMQANDLILLTTDGFLEWEDEAGNDFGVERFTELVRRVRDRKPAEIIAELYRSVVEFGGGTKQKDDLTAVIIKRVPA